MPLPHPLPAFLSLSFFGSHRALWSPFAPFCLGLQHRTDLPAGVPNKPLVEQILERHEVVVLAAVGVHIVIDSDVADAEHGEAFLDVQARVELISTEATEIFGHNDPDPAVFHV